MYYQKPGARTWVRESIGPDSSKWGEKKLVPVFEKEPTYKGDVIVSLEVSLQPSEFGCSGRLLLYQLRKDAPNEISLIAKRDLSESMQSASKELDRRREWMRRRAKVDEKPLKNVVERQERDLLRRGSESEGRLRFGG